MDLTLPTALVFNERRYPVRMFSLKDIKLATEDFSAKYRIGRGAYNVVYKGFIKGWTGIVAIKRYESSILETAEEFSAEVELLSTICYVHLVPFVGICNENKELIVVYKYMSHGTIEDHLYGNKRSRTGRTCWEERLNICIGAARGVNYLHEGNQSAMSAQELWELLVIWTQVTLVSGILTKASDVYSVGIVLLVVLSGRPAWEHHDLKSWYETCSQQGNFNGLIDPKLVGGIPSASLEKFVHLIGNCLHEDPKHRPVMAQVLVNLQESLDLLDINNGKEEREDQSTDTPSNFDEKSRYKDLSNTAERAEIRAEIARLQELHTVKGRRPVY